MFLRPISETDLTALHSLVLHAPSTDSLRTPCLVSTEGQRDSARSLVHELQVERCSNLANWDKYILCICIYIYIYIRDDAWAAADNYKQRASCGNWDVRVWSRCGPRRNHHQNMPRCAGGLSLSSSTYATARCRRFAINQTDSIHVTRCEFSIIHSSIPTPHTHTHLHTRSVHCRCRMPVAEQETEMTEWRVRERERRERDLNWTCESESPFPVTATWWISDLRWKAEKCGATQ